MSWKSKHTQVVETLRGLLLSGEWESLLPGYRALEQRLEVSRPTIEKALADLTTEGMLAQAEVGKSRRILVAPSARNLRAVSRTLLILGSVPVAELAWGLRHFMDLMLAGMRDEGWRVSYENFVFQQFDNPDEPLDHLVKSHRPDRVLIFGPTKAVALWFQARQIPFFCLGGAVLSIKHIVDGCGTTASHLAELGARHLIEHGHSRILYPIAPIHRRVKKVLLDEALAWGTGLDREEIDRLMPIRQSTEPKMTHANWRKWLAKLAPSAVLVQYHRELLSVIGLCNKAGIRIPEDLSVISLTWEPSVRWMSPEVTAVEHPIDSCVEWATRWLNHPAGERLGWQMLEGRLLAGNTVAPPRSQVSKASP